MAKNGASALGDGLDRDTVDKDVAVDTVAPSAPRPTRRLSDKLFVAFDQACDTDELDVAQRLLGIVETMMGNARTAHEGNRRRNMESLVAAFERLWLLRHPDR